MVGFREEGFLEKQVRGRRGAGGSGSGLFHRHRVWGAVVCRVRAPKLSTLEPLEPHVAKGISHV